nr:unnamed protein product [Callosobruchus chinensis]
MNETDSYVLLVRKRAAIKAKQTTFKKFVDNFKASVRDGSLEGLSKSKMNDLELRVERREKVLNEFEEIQAQIEVVCEDLDSQMIEREEFDNVYFSLLASCKAMISEYYDANQQSIKASKSSSEHSQISIESVRPVNNPISIVLPEIKLPKFGGGYEHWLEFRDTFNSLINENDSISETQRFHYLRAALEGGAAQVVRSIEFSSNNYQVAWQALLDRYNNDTMLIHNHMKAMIEMPNLSKESHIEIRKMLDSLAKHLSSLQALNQPVDHWDALLVYILSKKLDKTSAREWEHKASTSLQAFKTFLKDRANFLEKFSQSHTHTHSYQANTQINESKCIFCKRSGHYIQNCHEFLKLKCMAGSCKKCHKRHNTLLHQNVEKSNATNNASTSESFSGSSNIVSTSACHILLSTAIVHVKDVSGSFQQCRVLLDSGSQSNFITETACKHLGLKTDPLELAVIGINQVSSHIKKSCKVYLESMHTSYFTVATCLALPSINDYLPSQNIDTSSLNIPKHLNLGDPSYFTSSGVDMLLGAEFFYELLCIGQIRLGKNLPTLQKTVLGWVLSGPIAFVQPLQQTICHLTTNQEIHHLLTKFWEIEEPLVTKDLQFSSEEQ